MQGYLVGTLLGNVYTIQCTIYISLFSTPLRNRRAPLCDIIGTHFSNEYVSLFGTSFLAMYVHCKKDESLGAKIVHLTLSTHMAKY